MGSMDGKYRRTSTIRYDITINMARQTGRTRLARPYRPTIMTRLASSPRLDSMTGMTGKARLTRTVRLTRLRSLIRG